MANNEVRLEEACKKVLGMSSRRYRQLADEGVVSVPANGKIDILKACKYLLEYYRRLSRGQGSLSLTDERTRLTRIQADRKELELRKAKGELINVETAMRLWGQVLMSIRQKLLALPVKLSPLVLGVKRLATCKETVEKFTHEVLNELANPEFRKIAGVGGNQNNTIHSKTADKTKRKPVGRRKKSAKPGVKRGTR